MRPNIVKRTLKAGQPSIGTWLSLGSITAARFMARTGFAWLERPTACRDFSDPAEVEGVYLPEAAELVKELTGADLVLVFGHIQRDGSLKQSKHAPVYNAHVDYDVPTIRAIARRLLPPEEHERRLAQRI